MSTAATAFQIKRNQIGIIPTKPHQQFSSLTPISEPKKNSSPLRLFQPRSLSIGTTRSSSTEHKLRRRLKFTSTDELKIDHGPKLGSSVVLLEEEPEEKPTVPKLGSPKNEELQINKHPQKSNEPPQTNGFPPKNKSLLSPYSNGTETNSAQSTPKTNGVTPFSSRKRLLSDRGEAESQFPIMDRRMYNGWNGFSITMNRESGVGLYNPLNNCFLNAVLQSVVHIPQLTRTIFEPNSRMCIQQQQMPGSCFHCALKSHISRAINQNGPLSTSWIIPHLKKIFPQHRSGTQEDAHEMLTLLLGALEPLPPGKPNLKMHGTQGPGPSTPIEQIFGGTLRNRIVCNVCSQEHFNYERIREINLGLTRSCRTDVNQLIQDFFEKEQIQNFICSRCKQKRSATRYTTLLRAPSVLVIQLKRFNIYGGKNRLDVRPKPKADLTQYSMKGETFIYDLIGLIEHIGGGINFGHYICAMRGFKGDWFKFDDSERRPISIYEVLKNMDPYILFYTKIPVNTSFSPSTNGTNFPRRSLDSCITPSGPKQSRLNSYNGGTGSGSSAVGNSLPHKRFTHTFSFNKTSIN